MKTDSNKKLARRRDAAAVTESLALSEMVELYIFTQRCFLLINPPCVPVTALLSICRLFTRLTSFCDSITAVEQTSWQAERATTTAGLSSVTAPHSRVVRPGFYVGVTLGKTQKVWM